MNIVLELGDTDMRQALEKNPVVPATAIMSFMEQMKLALVYLHAKKIVHRDIKPSNILMFRQDSDTNANYVNDCWSRAWNARYKLCDFGLVNMFECHEPYATFIYGASLWFQCIYLAISV